MALKLSCPHCGQVHRLSRPYPKPGAEFQCWCGRVLAISYPPGLIQELEANSPPVPPPPVERPPQPRQPSAGPPQASAHEEQEREAERASPKRPRTPPRRQYPGSREEPQPRPAPQSSAPPAAPPAMKIPAGRETPRPAEGPVIVVPPSDTEPGLPARRPLWKRLVGWSLLLVLLGGAVAALTVTWAIHHYGQNLPGLDTLSNYRPPTVTTVYDRHGEVLGEIYDKRRYVVEYELLPEHLKSAFIAAEDANFWEHPGIDAKGITRAIITNLLEGERAQGASTITQQVARNFLLTSEKTYERKIKEMILSTRIEEAFDKEYILFLYLNEIYLGSGAYGVEAASRIYFDKHVEELTVAEAALLAGLPQRPSDYSPHHSWEQARGRQEYVLSQMLRKGFIQQDEHDLALEEDIAIVKKPNPARIKAPYFTEHVRRHLVDTYGEDRVYSEGLVVHTTCDLGLQRVAQESVIEQVEDLDWKTGWRGPLEQLEAEAIPARREAYQQELLVAERDRLDASGRLPVPDSITLTEGEIYQAVVLSVEKKAARVAIGEQEALIPLSWSKWMAEPNPNISYTSRRLADLRLALKEGDVVEVLLKNLKAADSDPFKRAKNTSGLAAARVYQKPALQGAILGFDLETGAITAMVGGIDIELSEFNRAIQAQRQVGSTFKPFVYNTAIASKEVTVASLVLDAPLAKETVGQNALGKKNIYKPGNFSGEHLGRITLREALLRSLNTPTVRLLEKISLEELAQTMQSFKIPVPLNPETEEPELDLSMALGSTSMTMLELGRAYSVFATYGEMVEPYVIQRIEDRDGNILEEHQPQEREQVLERDVATVTNWLLRQVATSGTAAATNKLGLELGGKTGTTDDSKDGWFVGFSPKHLAVAWVGYDQPRTMDPKFTGGTTALPMWMDYMEVAVPKADRQRFGDVPEVQWAKIDTETGKIAKKGINMPFLRGTLPDQEDAHDPDQVVVEDLTTLDF